MHSRSLSFQPCFGYYLQLIIPLGCSACEIDAGTLSASCRTFWFQPIGSPVGWLHLLASVGPPLDSGGKFVVTFAPLSAQSLVPLKSSRGGTECRGRWELFCGLSLLEDQAGVSAPFVALAWPRERINDRLVSS